MAIKAGSGALSFLGYAPEVTAGTGVAATDYIPIKPDAVTLKYDPKRTIEELAVGSLFTDNVAVDEDGMVEGDVQFLLYPSLGQKLIYLAAFLDTKTGSGDPYTHTGALSVPKPVTLEWSLSGQSWQYAGLYATKMKIASNGKKAPLVTISYVGITKPVKIAPTSPSYVPAADQPFAWREFSTATLLGAGAADKTIDSWELDIDFSNWLFYGNNQSGLPSDIGPNHATASGKFTKIFKTTAEWDNFAAQPNVGGSLVFGWARGTHSATFTMPAGGYKMDQHKTPMKGPITEDVEYFSLAPDAANPLSYVVLNATSTAYSAT